LKKDDGTVDYRAFIRSMYADENADEQDKVEDDA